ncbi:MAG: hypothetical protein AB7I30_00315 [Isosphaeraceae bacterium]
MDSAVASPCPSGAGRTDSRRFRTDLGVPHVAHHQVDRSRSSGDVGLACVREVSLDLHDRLDESGRTSTHLMRVSRRAESGSEPATRSQGLHPDTKAPD